MTCHKMVYIYCDADECGWKFDAELADIAQVDFVPDTTATEARRQLWKDGWRYRAGQDFCPKHASQAKGIV